MLLLFSGVNPRSDFEVIRVIWTSDLHGQLLPVPDFASVGLPRRKLGGWRNLVRLVERERTPATLLFDNGDFGFGSPEGDSSQGRLMIELMNRLGYDAGVLGARDFSGGIYNVEIIARSANFPLLGDPMLDVLLNRRSPLFRPYLVKEIRGIKVGIIGITDPLIPVLNRQEDIAGLVVDDPLVQVRRILPAVKVESAEVVIVFGHIDTDAGRRIADSISEVNMVICRGEPANLESQLSTVGLVAVVVSGVYGQRIGIADILFHKTERRVYAIEAQVRNVEEMPKTEAETAIGVSPERYILGDMGTIVARSEEEFSPDERGKVKLGLVVAEGIRWLTKTDIAILPLDALEMGLERGEITRRDLFNVVPYRERLRIVALPESLLVRLLMPVGIDGNYLCPAVAGADFFVTGEVNYWPRLVEVARLRLRERKSGNYRVVTTEGWLEKIGIQEKGRVLPENLTEMWLRFGEKTGKVSPIDFPRFYPATPGLVVKPAEGLININTADVELLCQLPGIGPKTAERIIEYRKMMGRFKSIEEITNVRGIGPKKFEKIKNLITVR